MLYMCARRQGQGAKGKGLTSEKADHSRKSDRWADHFRKSDRWADRFRKSVRRADHFRKSDRWAVEEVTVGPLFSEK
jgi:hypothetical protein